MSRAVVLLWLGTLSSHDQHEPDWASWARSRMVAVEDPSPDPALLPADHDDDLSNRVESLLSDARAAGYGVDSSAAEGALESAELLLRNHPGLPEAPWLMAEICHDRALLVRVRDPALASVLETRATVLAGGRVRAFAEIETDEHAILSRPEEGAEPRATRTPLEGPLASDEVDVDGAPTEAPFAILAGEHHVRVIRRGRQAWAGWVTASAGTVRLPVPGVVPCSETDFAGVRFDGERVQVGGAVLCPRWAAARAVTDHRIEIATCEQSACGTLLPWSRGWGADLEGPMHPPWPPRPRRTWIAWTVASVAAVAAGTILLYREGAFDRQGRPREHLSFTALPPP